MIVSCSGIRSAFRSLILVGLSDFVCFCVQHLIQHFLNRFPDHFSKFSFDFLSIYLYNVAHGKPSSVQILHGNSILHGRGFLFNCASIFTLSKEDGWSMDFSIIVPIFNQEKYLRDCIESLVEQKGSSFEVLLMNDGSTDKSELICKEYKNKYPEIVRCYSHDNIGLLLTRKRGIEESKGDYILSVDSDDMLFPGSLEELKRTINNTHADIVLFNATRNLEIRNKLLSYSFIDGASFSGDHKYTLYELLCSSHVLNNMCFKCIKRSIIDIEKVYINPSGISNGEDLYQSLPIIDSAELVVFLDKSLYYYRPNGNSMTGMYRRENYASIKKVFLRREYYANKWDRGDGHLCELTRRLGKKITKDHFKSILMSDLPHTRKVGEIIDVQKEAFTNKYFSNEPGIINKILMCKSRMLMSALVFLFEIRIKL